MDPSVRMALRCGLLMVSWFKVRNHRKYTKQQQQPFIKENKVAVRPASAAAATHGFLSSSEFHNARSSAASGAKRSAGVPRPPVRAAVYSSWVAAGRDMPGEALL